MNDDLIKIEHFTPNKNGRDFVIGDLHGMWDLLSDKLDSVSFNVSDDRLFSVGDLIDRGPESLKCTKLMYMPWFHTVKGNHEDMFVQWWKDPSLENWYFQNGGDWVKQHYGEEFKFLEKLVDKIEALPHVIMIGEKGEEPILICHAEFPFYSLEDFYDELDDRRALEQLMWGRNKITHGGNDRCEGIKQSIHGHTIITEIVEHGNATFIDTGAYVSSFRDDARYDLTLMELNYE